MFIDASALCAILLDEPEADAFKLKVVDAARCWVSAIVVWETVQALARENGVSTAEAREEVDTYLAVAGASLVLIGAAEQDGALEAVHRFGKGRHPAKLNMGDCFAYGCAKANGLPLLFKGDDFSQTDIAQA
jgi:ribonuclease VapC